MSEVPDELWYTKEHEWIRIEGDEVVIGITDHAQNALTDIVYIELPEDGMDAGEMEEFAIVESVKSASPIFAPVAGTVIAVNMILEDAPETMNSDPYGEGWIVRMVPSDMASVRSLLDAVSYRDLIQD